MGGLTLDAIRDPGAGESYPRALLEGCESALVLFAAGFLGRQDAYWVAEAGLEADCVDLDQERLDEMADIYPAAWRFTGMDAFAFAEAAQEFRETWDIVSIDCPTNLFGRCAHELPLWCSLARKAVVLGCEDWRMNWPIPKGWNLTGVRYRSSFKGGVYWAVLERV